jgi:SAM-dependent methyltransferase
VPELDSSRASHRSDLEDEQGIRPAEGVVRPEAEAYAAFRTAPPREVVDGIVVASAIRARSRVLEIGCGTGQLSAPLANLGVELVAVEPGPHLAALAKRNLERFPHAPVLVSSFEEWQLPVQKFDAVICASAFHWLDAELRDSKCAAAVRPGGALTILHVHHVRGGTPGFFADTQPYYRRWGLTDDPMFELPDPNELQDSYPELDRRLEFNSVGRYRFEIPMRYTAASYVGWLRTDSLVNSVDDESRVGFLGDMERLITLQYNGAVERNFLYEVIVARRVS